MRPLLRTTACWRSWGNGPLDVDFANGFRSQRNKGNNYLIDRQAQKTETFTGITGINVQDRAVQETMGPIVDRSKEHLGPADRAIIVTRQQLMLAIKNMGRRRASGTGGVLLHRARC